MLHVTRHILHARNALHSVLSSFKYNYVTCNNCNMSHFTCHMSYTLHVLGNAMHSVPSAFNLCHISTCHMSHVAFHISHAIHYMSLEMPLIHACCTECIQPLSHFNLSYVICDMSHVTCHL